MTSKSKGGLLTSFFLALAVLLAMARFCAAQIAIDPNTSYLGIVMTDVDSNRAGQAGLQEERGVAVTAVEVGGPAFKAGLHPGDILLQYNGSDLLGAQHLMRLLAETPVGRKVRVQVWRDGSVRALIATTAPRPQNLPATPAISAEIVPVPILLWRNLTFGIECEDLDGPMAGYFGVAHGVLVRSVRTGSPADHAGLRVGDVLVAMGKQDFSAPQDLSRLSSANQGADTVSLVRDRKKLQISLAARTR